MERRQSSRLLRLLSYRFCSCANVSYALLVWVADRPVSLARLTIASTLILYLRRVQGSQEAYPYGAKRSQSTTRHIWQIPLTERLRQPLVLLRYTMNGFLATATDSLQAIPTGSSAFAALLHPLFCRWLRLLHFLQVHLCSLPFA